MGSWEIGLRDFPKECNVCWVFERERTSRKAFNNSGSSARQGRAADSIWLHKT